MSIIRLRFMPLSLPPPLPLAKLDAIFFFRPADEDDDVTIKRSSFVVVVVAESPSSFM